ncbi:MAG TPA: TIGR02147 family protein [Bdellovibrionales bacterium]|nr:TIGR02147 family protein [Bdellovibrionales bacterium]
MEAIRFREKPTIFEYDNYRAFLGDTYAHLKETKSFFSFRYFSKAAGFSSPNFLKLVIEGKRNLSGESASRFAAALKLNKAESEFFLTLVQFNQADSTDEKSRIATQILKSRSYRKIHPLNQSLFRYYSRWYYVAIREMVAWPAFKGDPVWIAKRLAPQITAEEAAEAMTELAQLGLIRQTSAGGWAQSEPLLNTDNEVASTAVRSFHREMMRLGSESMDRFARERREISSVTVPVSELNAKKIKELIQSFRKEVLAIVDGDETCDRVYQLNFQFFPLAEDVGGES